MKSGRVIFNCLFFKMAKIIFGLVGPIASGKDTVKKYLEKKYGAQNCRFSTILRDVLNRIEVPVERKNLQNISTLLRANFGEDVLAKVIASDASKLGSEIVVVDGVRRMADIKYLSDLPNFFLTAIEADPKIRYGRLVKRNENVGDDKKTYDQFLKDHEAEADREVPIVMKKAKYSLNNDGTFEDLHKQIDELVATLVV